jgi:hypothetical protein
VNPIDIFCDCKDFSWRSSLHTEDRLKATVAKTKGEVRNYVRKTPPPTPEGGYPFANPQSIPFMCKHLLTVIDYLSSRGLIK